MQSYDVINVLVDDVEPEVPVAEPRKVVVELDNTGKNDSCLSSISSVQLTGQ
jgi:hypothetical protein